MVQENNILRCYSCHIFQVHIVKKAKKWQCKICNEKQSVQHVYFTGSGGDCRLRVQHLNFTANNGEQQGFKEASNKTVATETEQKSVRVIERPVITHSKWTKYMVPQAAFYESVSNDNEDFENQSANFNDQRKILETDFTIIDNCSDKTFRDQKENERSSPLRNNLIQNTFNTGSKNEDRSLSTFSKTSFQVSDTPCPDDNYKYDRQYDLSMKVHNFPCTLSPNDRRIEMIDQLNHSLLSGSNSSFNFDQPNQDVTVVCDRAKRKFHMENSVPQTESSSFSCQRLRKTLKPSNLGDQSSIRKEHLRDIVKENRKNVDKSSETGVSVTKAKSASGKINHSPKVDISKLNVKKKTIFETDYDDLDDILDF